MPLNWQCYATKVLQKEPFHLGVAFKNVDSYNKLRNQNAYMLNRLATRYTLPTREKNEARASKVSAINFNLIHQLLISEFWLDEGGEVVEKMRTALSNIILTFLGHISQICHRR